MRRRAFVMVSRAVVAAMVAPAQAGAAPPNAAARDTVMLKVPGGTYQTVTATSLDEITTDGRDYQGVVDVTSQVANAGSGTYWVANVQAGTGRDRQAGWSLVVAYRDMSQPPRNLSSFDGFQVVNSGNPNVTIPVSGFRTPTSGPVRTRLGFVAYEGDAGSTGDSVRLNTTTLSDAANPPQNFFNSAVSADGVAVHSKTPDCINQLGFDAIFARADGVLPNGATSAAIHLTTGGETYFPGAVTFATDLYSPDVSLTKAEDVNGGQVTPGDVLRYTVTARNDGQDDGASVILRDTVPANTTYVPGSSTVDDAAKTDALTDDNAGDASTNTAVFWVGRAPARIPAAAWPATAVRPR